MALGHLGLDLATESATPIGSTPLQPAELQPQLRGNPFEDHVAEVVARGRVLWPWVANPQNDSAEVHAQRGSLAGGAGNIAKLRAGAKPDPKKAQMGSGTSVLFLAGILWLGLSTALGAALRAALSALLGALRAFRLGRQLFSLG